MTRRVLLLTFSITLHILTPLNLVTSMLCAALFTDWESSHATNAGRTQSVKLFPLGCRQGSSSKSGGGCHSHPIPKALSIQTSQTLPAGGPQELAALHTKIKNRNIFTYRMVSGAPFLKQGD